MSTVLHTDVLVVGGGMAGLLTALHLAKDGSNRITLLAKAPVGSGAASILAQGGVAAAVAENDSPQLHAADTHTTAAGLGEGYAIERLTSDAATAIANLRQLGFCWSARKPRTVAAVYFMPGEIPLVPRSCGRWVRLFWPLRLLI